MSHRLIIQIRIRPNANPIWDLSERPQENTGDKKRNRPETRKEIQIFLSGNGVDQITLKSLSQQNLGEKKPH